MLSRSWKTIAFMIIATAVACAHITVSPDKSVSGKSETYSFRVPNEKEGTTTVKFELQLPSELGRVFFEAMPGWKLSLEKDDAGKVTRASWSGGSIGSSEYAQFRCVVRNPPNVTKLVWKVIQYYADGTKDEWTGEQGSRRPAPTTTLSNE